MRQLLLISLLGLLNVSFAETQETESVAQIPIILDQHLDKIESYLTARVSKKGDSQKVLTALGFSNIEKASQTTTLIDDTWLSTITVKRKQHGIFKLLAQPHSTPFIAPKSTDIAIQASLDLSHLPQLIRDFHQANGTPHLAEQLLASTIASTKLEPLLETARPTFHLCVDFDDEQELFLGKESIGRPHFIVRIDGMQQALESTLGHFIRTRNALFTKQPTASGAIYTLPAYFAEAIAGYQPVIAFDTVKNTTTIASSRDMLERLDDSQASLRKDSAFAQTWESMPAESSIKAYISKRALKGFHHFYKLGLKEQWTDNPTFLKKQFLISGAMAQLNSSQSGLAFSLSSDENRDTITLKSPFPSTMLLWILGQ